jgi:hypothetical protein
VKGRESTSTRTIASDLHLAVNDYRRRGELSDRGHLLLDLVLWKQSIEVVANRIAFACSLGRPPLGGLVDGEHRAVQARSIPQQVGRQQRYGRQHGERQPEFQPIEPGFPAGLEEEREQHRADDDHGQQHAGRSGTWRIAGEQGHPARIRAQRQHAHERMTSAACRAIGVKKATDVRVPAPMR